MPKKGKRQGKETGGWSGIFLAVGKGSGVALGVTALLLFCCAAAVSLGWITQVAAERCCILSCVLGTLAGGAVSVVGGRTWALPVGAATGMVEFLVLILLGLLFFEGAPAGSEIPEILLSCLCGGGMAGILGRKTKGKRRR